MNDPAPWSGAIPAEELRIYEAAGYGTRPALRGSPALLIVDATLNFTGDRPGPILDAIKRFPNACGDSAWASIPVIARMREAAHAAGVPVIYTRGPLKKTALTLGSWQQTTTMAIGDDAVGESFTPEIAPDGDDVVVEKLRPSAFSGTPLTGMLIQLGVDTLLVCGGTTSGCVRATVIDAFSLGYAVGVVHDATFDRGATSRAVNLFDMEQKYARLIDGDEGVVYLKGLAP